MSPQDLENFYDLYMGPVNGVPFDLYCQKFGRDLVYKYYQSWVANQEATAQEGARMIAQSLSVEQLQQYFSQSGLLAASGMEFEDWLSNPAYESALRFRAYNWLVKTGQLPSNLTGHAPGATGQSAFEIAAAAWSNHVPNGAVPRPVV